MKDPKGTIQITARVAPIIAKALKRASLKMGESKNCIIDRALKDFLKRHGFLSLKGKS